MNELEAYVKDAERLGFFAAAPLDMCALEARPEIRMLCAPDKCESYGKTWVCPPGCGELPECAARLAGFHAALLIESKYEHVDTGDLVYMKVLAAEHNRRLLALRELVAREHPKVWFLSTGSCEFCDECSYPSAPCKKYEILRGSVSAYGLDVERICESAGIEYAFAAGTVRYIAFLLI